MPDETTISPEDFKNLAKKIAELEKENEKLRRDSRYLSYFLNYGQEKSLIFDAKTLEVEVASSKVCAPSCAGKKCHEALFGLENPCPENGLSCPFSAVIETSAPSHAYRTNGEKAYVIALYPVFEGNGAVSKVIEHVIDVTEPYNLRRRLMESEKLYKTLIDQIPDCVYLIDAESLRFVFANKAFFELMGYSPRDLEKMKVYDIIFESKRSVDENVELISRYKSGFFSERKYRKKNGEIIISDVSASLVKYEKKDSLLVSFRDVTERTEYARALEESKKKLEELNLLKSTIISNLSHELRTPLNGILGFAQILLEVLEDKDALELVKTIFYSGKRLHKTIESLLTLNELESYEKRLRFEKTNLAEFFSDAEFTFADLLAEKELELKKDFRDKEISAEIDIYAITQAVYHLIDNAAKYSDKGDIVLRVDSEFARGELKAKIEVEDFGVGIDEAKGEIIFEAFRQGSEGIDRNYEGLGIGLAISKKFVTLLGGSLSFVNKSSGGAIFTIKLRGFYE